MKSEDLQESLNSLRDVYMPADRDREISANLQQEITRHRTRRSRFARGLWFRQWGAVSAAAGIAVVLVCVLVPWRGMGANGQRSMQTASSTPDTAGLQSEANGPAPVTQSAAHVAVMNPILGGPARPNPEIYTYVEPPKSLVKSLKVYVNLTGQTGTIFPPATLHVTSDSSDPFSYAKDYVITKSDGPARQYVLTVPVPPQSGKYAVSVSLAGKPKGSLFHPLPADIHDGGPLPVFNYGPVTMYVDHGGYYRTAVVPVNQTVDQANLTVTVTEVVMNSDGMHVKFRLTGKDACQVPQLWGPSDYAMLTLPNGQSREVSMIGASLGPAGAAPPGELNYEPMTMNVKAIRIDLEFLLDPNGVKTKPFTFNIPLG